jgi:hypothetical protein
VSTNASGVVSISPCERGHRSTNLTRPVKDSERRGSVRNRVEPARTNRPPAIDAVGFVLHGEYERVAASLHLVDEEWLVETGDEPGRIGPSAA